MKTEAGPTTFNQIASRLERIPKVEAGIRRLWFRLGKEDGPKRFDCHPLSGADKLEKRTVLPTIAGVS